MIPLRSRHSPGPPNAPLLAVASVGPLRLLEPSLLHIGAVPRFGGKCSHSGPALGEDDKMNLERQYTGRSGWVTSGRKSVRPEATTDPGEEWFLLPSKRGGGWMMPGVLGRAEQLAILGGPKSVSIQTPHFRWPIVEALPAIK